VDLSNIDPRWLDVDFRGETAYTFGDTGPKPHDPSRYSAYEDSATIYPSSQWPEMVKAMDADGGGAERLITRIYNQKQEGSCVANATSQAHEIVQCKQLGKHSVTHLSAISLYKRIGSGPSSGSSVDDALDEMAKNGILPLDDEKNRAKYCSAVMPNTGYYEKFPSDWQNTAKQFKALEWSIVRTVEGLISALLNEHPVVVGRQGHSICYVRPVYKDGSLFVPYANSWGEWGFGMGDFTYGFGLDSMNLIRQSAGWAFALRSVTVPA
jgi:hypothetical protein